ncbi:MAG: type II toxin-antitoxin system RelE family toxin [Treponema lecithinolyticum]|uniref:type II toxin-antitoxin system RelE family toxin n=1 Tax=Treponema lecithinolyticum TaxID=53418 RepID=UPI003FA21E4B
MIKYLDEILKKLKKGLLPKEIFIHLNNAFIALDLTKDLDLFDIKQLKTSKDKKRVYYRIRKGKYRAIFYLEEENIYVIALDKREEVYKKWQ